MASKNIKFNSFELVQNNERFYYELNGGSPANYFIYEVVDGVKNEEHCLYVTITFSDEQLKINKVQFGDMAIGDDGANSKFKHRNLGHKLVLGLLSNFPKSIFFIGAAGEISPDGMSLLNRIYNNHPESLEFQFRNGVDVRGGLVARVL